MSAYGVGFGKTFSIRQLGQAIRAHAEVVRSDSEVNRQWITIELITDSRENCYTINSISTCTR